MTMTEPAADKPASNPILRFAAFEVDPAAGELRKSGVRIHLQDKPLRILVILMERPGAIVTREELRQKLWDEDTHVEFEHSLNTAVNKLRRALGDSAETPRFIETIPRRGYRFVGQAAPPAGTTPAPALSRARKAWIGVAGGVLIGAGVAGILFSRLASEPAPFIPVQLTAYPGQERDPSLSPDATHVAFSWNGENRDNDDIYVKRIDSGPPLRLTTDPAVDRKPVFSPRGDAIGFLRRLDRNVWAILLIPPLGGRERKVAEVTTSDGLAWLPDGRHLVVTDRPLPEESAALFRLDIDTGARVRLTTPPDNSQVDHDPAVSPDGRSVAFTRRTGPGVSRLYLLSLAGNLLAAGESRELTDQSHHPGAAAWTGGGGDLIFSDALPGTANSIWRVPAAGTGPPYRLAIAGEQFQRPTAARDRLVYQKLTSDANIWRLDSGSRKARPFVASTRIDRSPSFSPTGEQVVFTSERSGTAEIWLCDADGSNAVQLTSFEGPRPGSPRFSPDGEQITFDATEHGHRDIYVISRHGGQPRRLTANPAHDAIPSFSRDGRWVYFASNRGGDFQIWKKPAPGGEAIRVTDRGAYIGLEAPDGKSLYYTKAARGPAVDWCLWRLPLDGGPEVKVLDAVLPRNFAVTASGLYYIAPPDNDGVSELRFRSAASGDDQLLSRIRKPVFWRLAVSPDERTILYSRLDHSDSDLMLVENFR